jgi:hypothetical protein
VNVVVEAIEKDKREKKDFKRQGAKKRRGRSTCKAKHLSAGKNV